MLSLFSGVHLMRNTFRMLILILRQLGSCLRAWKNLCDHPRCARLSALTDHLGWDVRRSTSQACLWAVYTHQSSVEHESDSTKGSGELWWQMAYVCISVLLLLITVRSWRVQGFCLPGECWAVLGGAWFETWLACTCVFRSDLQLQPRRGLPHVFLVCEWAGCTGFELWSHQEGSKISWSLS